MATKEAKSKGNELSDERGKECLQQANGLMGRLDTETALFENLLVYLQNATLGDVIGHRIEFRRPEDSQGPRLVVAKDGQLSVWDDSSR